MITDDSQRGNMANVGNRKMSHPKYPEKMPNYSPSTSYNYSPASGFVGGQHPRRRNENFKRGSLNVSEKLVKQNDMIIRLLKEIRDRLPPPPAEDVKPDDAGIETVDDSQIEDETIDEGGQQGPEVF
jgi:hypothetical protein